MKTLLFALSYHHRASIKSAPMTPISVDDAGPGMSEMTLIFRIAFSAVFSSGGVLHERPVEAEYEGETFVLRRAVLLHSPAARMGGGPSDYYMLAVAVDVSDALAGKGTAQELPKHLLAAEGKTGLLRALGLGAELDALSPAAGLLVGHNAWLVDRVDDERLPTLTSVFGFYVYGWLKLLSAERTQMSLALGPAGRGVAELGRRITAQGVLLLDVQRYILCRDRANDPALKAWCEQLVAKLKLVSRHEHLSKAHRDFEHHLDNTVKLSQTRQLGSVQNLITTLTLFSVPISIFSALLAVNLKSDIFLSTDKVVGDGRIYMLMLFGVILVCLPYTAFKALDLLLQRRSADRQR